MHYSTNYLELFNSSYIEEMYKIYSYDKNALDESWIEYFELLQNNINSKNIIQHYFTLNSLKDFNLYNDINDALKTIEGIHLLNKFRYFGYQIAKIDPLNIINSNSINYETNKKLYTLSKILKKTYCSSIGIEYIHLRNIEEKIWIQKNFESVIGVPYFKVEEKKLFIEDILISEEFEHYLGFLFPGAKRFSLEGADSLIPILKTIIRSSEKNNIKEIFIGMAHRGRLNVLVNILGKKSKDIFEEFSENYIGKKYFGTGDVKYHLGFNSIIKNNNGYLTNINLAFNPSHLEIIAPVVIGSTKARYDYLIHSNKIILPIVIHGDSAIIAQGIVQETLNLSNVPGYEVGGTIHIIINNQIGFTTSNPKELRSSYYCTDISKMLESPVFHVNGDNIESVIFVTKLALDFRNKFKRDVFIDLVCYRRHGHNETEDPSVTQPMMYKIIKKHPKVSEVYKKKLIIEKIITNEYIDNFLNSYRVLLKNGECILKDYTLQQQIPLNKNESFNNKQIYFNEYKYKLDLNILNDLIFTINYIPSYINTHVLVSKMYKNRLKMLETKKSLDWGSAESLAYATILKFGKSVRLSGEDTIRGTFFHRHAIIYDQKNGSEYIPLNNIVSNNNSKFTILNSTLSEAAILAFEYGYSIVDNNTLNIWEAQFGDFANAAQVVIDQFISSAKQKWGQSSGLILMLPHGYEGQGPEHSSARIERYLQLCSNNNMIICIPSTPVQLYHLLYRQAIYNIKIPLILISPKSLLRHPLAISSLDEIANKNFYPIIDEIELFNLNNIKKIIMCSGKIYYDLLEQRKKNKQKNVIIIRIEQLYPFPDEYIKKIIYKYSHIENFIWCQEEPLNQGAWYYFKQKNLDKLIPKNSKLNCISRPSSSVTSVGYSHLHKIQQQELIDKALK